MKKKKRFIHHQEKETPLQFMHRKQHGKCHYCGKETFIVAGTEKSAYIAQCHNRATIEHLFPRQDLRRILIKNNVQYTVMACNECNDAMNIAWQARFYEYSAHNVPAVSLLSMLSEKN